MRKILLVVLLLISISSFAQDIAKYRSMSKEEIVQFSNQIGDIIRNEWQFYKEKEFKDNVKLTYIPTGTSVEMLNKIKNVGLDSSGVDYFDVNYNIVYEGRDLDLEIKGVRKYQFLSVNLKFKDAFVVWQKYFNNEATIEDVRNYKNHTRKIKKENIHWLYKFNKSESPYWTILKFY